MQIRTMTLNDYEQMYALWLSTPGMGLNNLDDSKDGVKRFLARNPTTCFVAEKDKKIIGVILAGHDGRRGYIYHTAIAAAHRRQGIAAKLVIAVLQALREHDINKVALVAFSRNADGNRFWESQGFTVRTDLTYRNKSLVDLVRIDT